MVDPNHFHCNWIRRSRLGVLYLLRKSRVLLQKLRIRSETTIPMLTTMERSKRFPRVSMLILLPRLDQHTILLLLLMLPMKYQPTHMLPTRRRIISAPTPTPSLGASQVSLISWQVAIRQRCLLLARGKALLVIKHD